ncbi:GNAT family N-acetyltransferase [Apibacter raozihei]|uniref:GNAT family N-acetyltransferase n=1 Tax=Apibacter TaxID=1778601 RepID=UPI000FE39739|nr:MULTISPECIES: GNAT family N-acetyltransferase [Apibacter]
MANKKLRKELQFREIGVQHLDQYNELLRYVFQVTNKILEDSGYEEGEIMRSKRPILQRADAIGWFNDEHLVSQLCIYPCRVNIHGKIVKMGGLTGVGTYPEYANMGLMNNLIITGLERMKEKGQTISYLYPYSVPYYRRKGWEIMSDHMTFTIKDSQLPKHIDLPGYVERKPVDDIDVINTYNRFAQTNHGALIRGQYEWEEYWRWENEDERYAAVYYNNHDEPMGYVMYWISGDVFNIKELIYLDMESQKGLWNFISAHFSMVNSVKGNIYKNDPIAFLLDDSQIMQTIKPYYMARIVDVEAFLEKYPFLFSSRPFHFLISDPIAKWNNGPFGLHWSKKGKIEIIKEPIGPSVELDICTLTAMLMSYRSPSYFYKIERLKTSFKMLRTLENIIPKEQPYFSDYF